MQLFSRSTKFKEGNSTADTGTAATNRPQIMTTVFNGNLAPPVIM
jgi:hypothetical protein